MLGSSRHGQAAVAHTGGMSEPSLEGLTEELRAFADERDWQQFHTPRNLVLALCGEVGELASEVQWLSDDELMSARNKDRLEDEVADVLLYLARLADVLNINLAEVAWRKMADNARRYPPDAVRGSSKKMPH